ncbi:MAG: maleylacetoacetate isomerase [Bdellovibrionota bacterium]
MPHNITLYHYWRSSCSWRVRWALQLKGIEHNLIAVDLLKNEQQQSTYLQQNPSGFVPSLIVDGKAYGESMAIIEWINEKWPHNPLLPEDPFARLLTRQLYMTIASGTQPLQNLIAQQFHSDDKDKRVEYARYWINRGLKAYETILNQHGLGGHFSLGETITMADLCLIPQCYNARRYTIDLEQFPKIKKIEQRSLATEACQRAAPDSFQP